MVARTKLLSRNKCRRRGVDAELVWSAIDQELSVAEMRMVREMEWERTHGR